MKRVETTGASRYCIEVEPRSQSQVQAWLVGQGEAEVRVIASGYLSAILDPDCCKQVRLLQGVRRLFPIVDEDGVGSVINTETPSTRATFKVGDTVSIARFGLSVVGRIVDLGEKEARVVISLFGRALCQSIALTELRPVSVPEVWQ